MRTSKLEKRKTNKTTHDVVNERDRGHARIINYGNDNKVELFWGLNKKCRQDQIALLKIDDKEAYISAEEMMRFLRWV